MKRLLVRSLIGLCSLFIITSCDSKPAYADKLRKCLDSDSVNLLNQMVTLLESQLFDTYQDNGSDGYKMFLTAVSSRTEPANMMMNQGFLELSELYRDSPLFSTMKVRASSLENDDFLVEIPPVEGEEPQVYDPWVMNPDAPYAKCLMAESDEISRILETFHGLDISPTLTAAILLSRLEDSDYENPLVKMVIATHVYYEIGIIMPDIQSTETR